MAEMPKDGNPAQPAKYGCFYYSTFLFGTRGRLGSVGSWLRIEREGLD